MRGREPQSYRWVTRSKKISTFFATVCIVLVSACKEKGSDDTTALALLALAGSEASILAPLKTYQTKCWNESGTEIACAGTGHDGEHQAGREADFTGPTQHAIYVSDYTTTDNATGLVWKSCSEGLSGADCGTGSASQTNWSTANSTTCDDLNSANSGNGYAGRTDWRLPEVAELETIINYGTSSPAAFATGFPAKVAGSYWSASAYVPDTSKAWRVDFSDGQVNSLGKTNNSYVRCVSPGPRG